MKLNQNSKNLLYVIFGFIIACIGVPLAQSVNAAFLILVGIGGIMCGIGLGRFATGGKDR